MFNTYNLQKKKAILITLAIIILCVIITLIVLLNLDTGEIPNKAVYVLN